MKINLKLLLPILLGFIALFFVTNVYVFDKIKKESKERYFEHTKVILNVADNKIVSDLLNSDFGGLYETLDMLGAQKGIPWKDLTIVRNDGKVLYPLIPIDHTKQEYPELIHVEHALKFEGKMLGKLVLDLDWSEEKKRIDSDIQELNLALLFVLVTSLFLSATSYYKIVFSPLVRLLDAIHLIKKGKYYPLEHKGSNDEVGKLFDSYNEMIRELGFQKSALDQHAIVSIADKAGNIIYVNDKFTEISGYSADELLGKNHRVLRSGMHDKKFYSDMWESIAGGNVWHGEICNSNKSGKKYWVSSTIVPHLDENGIPDRYLSIRTDITAQKNIETKLEHLANHDALTGLPTRRLGLELIEHAISVNRRSENLVAVFFIDLDGFKAVNDTYGHDVGDLLLIKASTIMQETLRESDSVIRLGGDEFLILLEGTNSHENVAQIATKLIDKLSTPLDFGAATVQIGASIGISLCYHGTPCNADSLIEQADSAMYQIKKRGKNNYQIFEN